jgi:uncharacterized protein (DUF111 family)
MMSGRGFHRGYRRSLHRLGLFRHRALVRVPPALGSGWVKADHGNLPLPAPAALALL